MAHSGKNSKIGSRRKRNLLRLLIAPIQTITGPWNLANGIGWTKLILFLLIINWAFVEIYSIPSGSMEPTLHGDPRFLRGDRVAVNKLLFGPRIPFTTIRLMSFKNPRRWDVVVFNAVDPEAEHQRLIKRVVGLPGERIHIAEGKIFVNGVMQVPPPELGDVLNYTTTIRPPDELVRQSLLRFAQGRVVPSILNPKNDAVASLSEDITRLYDKVRTLDLDALDDAGAQELTADVRSESFEVVRKWLQRQFDEKQPAQYGVLESDEFALVPPGHFLMLGDNSANSLDGRFFGWVPHRNLYGRAFAVALPPAHMRDLSGFTDTALGPALLFGIPLLLVLYELTRSFVAFSWKVRGESVTPLEPGDRVIVHRLSLGLRLPFTDLRLTRPRPLRKGQIVAYVDRTDGPSHDLRFGVVMEDRTAGESEAPVAVSTSLIDQDVGLDYVEFRKLAGVCGKIWWPPRRAGKSTNPTSETTTA